MREILFRGKRTDNGEWVYGDLIHRKIWGHEVTIIRVSDGGFDCYEEYEVIPETVGQYTGLTDRNGTKIFEGDIVQTEDCCYVVLWDSVRATYYLRNPIARVLTDFYHYFGEDLILIGNIHDNPELLEGAEK